MIPLMKAVLPAFADIDADARQLAYWLRAAEQRRPSLDIDADASRRRAADGHLSLRVLDESELLAGEGDAGAAPAGANDLAHGVVAVPVGHPVVRGGR